MNLFYMFTQILSSDLVLDASQQVLRVFDNRCCNRSFSYSSDRPIQISVSDNTDPLWATGGGCGGGRLRGG